MRWFTAIGGLIAATAAVIVLQTLSTTSVEQATAEPSGVPPPAAVFFEDVASIPVDDSVLESLPGLSPSVAEALAAAGYSGFATDESIDASLSPEVVQTLVANGAVLVIAEDGGTDTVATEPGGS